MRFLKLSVLCSTAIIVSACGGGGGGKSTPSKVSSSLASSASISSIALMSSSSSSSAPTVAISLSQSELNFEADITGSAPAPVEVTATIANASGPVYIVSTGFAPSVEAADVALVENGQATITFTPVDPGRLSPGSQSEKIYVRACKDEECLEEYPGTMKTITANYNVTAPTFTINKKKITFNITDDQVILPSTTILVTTSQQTPIDQFSIYTFNSNGFPDWLGFSQSWGGTSGSILLGVEKNLSPGTYTAHLGTYLYEFPLSHRIDVTVNVTSGSGSSSSSSSSVASCNGQLFTDSVCTQEWQAVSLFEQHKINLSDYKIIKDSLSGEIVTLSTVDSGDSSHGQVLDVQYNSNQSYYGQIGIDTVHTVDGLDMSEYANGKLMFDVKVISKGDANVNLNVKVECTWPCQSNLHEVNVPSLNTWTSVEIPIADLVAEGLNLERISNGFIILPERNSQSNSHFQVDNVRWVK